MFDFLSQKFSTVLNWVSSSGRVTQEAIDKIAAQVEEALLEADVPYDVAQDFVAQIKADVNLDELKKASNPGHKFIKTVHKKLLLLLGGEHAATTKINFMIPSAIMVMGLQGAGKTTTLAKLARDIKKDAEKRGKKRKILCSSIDYYRPAAREQLAVLCEQVGVDYYHAQSDNARDAAQEIQQHFKTHGYELLLFDTAGRLHVDEQMLDELVFCEQLIKPRYKILVLDAMTGQESLQVAKSFDNAVPFSNAILTKMDSDARGGAAIAFHSVLKKNIVYVGTGEKIDDLEPFIPERIVSRILGMGDLATLLEKADETINKDEQEQVARRMMGGQFSLDDFARQMDMVNNMGALTKIARYLPGMQQLSPEVIEKGQQEMKFFRAIISSMTKKERLMPHILDGSRKKRVASGAGVQVEDINQLLQKFEQSKHFVKMMKKMGKFKGLF